MSVFSKYPVWVRSTPLVLFWVLLLTALHAPPVSADADPAVAGTRRWAMPDAVLLNPPEGSELLDANTRAADALCAVLAARLGAGSPILVATLADGEQLERSSAFGRVTMQQVASRLGQYGYQVLEARLGRSLVFSPQGEFLLSRDAARLMRSEYDAQAALVGTYSLAGGTVYVSLRVVRLDDAAVVAAHEYHLPVRGDTRRLMAGQDDLWNRYVGRRPAFSGQTAGLAPPAAAGRTDGRPVAPAPALPSVSPSIDPAAMPLLKEFPSIGTRSSATAGKPVVKKVVPAKKQAAKKQKPKPAAKSAPGSAVGAAAKPAPAPQATPQGTPQSEMEPVLQPEPVWRTS